jgi:hypothetical protein
MCTHGSDPAPLGLSVKRRVQPIAAAPLAAGTTVNALAVCEGDGTSGRRVEVLYVHGSTSRYSQYLETFRTLAEGVDVIFNESARETGGERHVRYVTETVNGACRPAVRGVQIADSALNANDWAPLLNAVKAAATPVPTGSTSSSATRPSSVESAGSPATPVRRTATDPTPAPSTPAPTAAAGVPAWPPTNRATPSAR